ncbi:glycosyltransferase family 39 protein [Pseudonocardia nematodicida]|uniref:Glycosyltransferase family 39 protein n=1 Tax=Pseudonocardia nematodicida TaxID=1206997 RepID=A0ABV1KAV0_9PSEU
MQALRDPLADIAWRSLLLTGVGSGLLLLVTAGRYGYHRDELYFLRSGREPGWGHADNGPLTPLIARTMDTITQGSLVGLRLPAVLMAVLTVVLTGVIARELGAGRGAQVLAAACMGGSAVLMRVDHTLATASLDLLVWTTVSWLAVRALRDESARDWLLAGLVAGIGLQNKWQPAFLLAALLVGILLLGPRAALRSPWPWLAGLLALLLWAPNLWWQATHGWPQLELSSAIAAGGSHTSEPWYLFAPYQLVLVSPLLFPVWAVGWWQLLRNPRLAPFRGFAVAYVLLVAVFTVTGGKPYYLAGLYPVLLAAGAGTILAALSVRTTVSTLAVSTAIMTVLSLPVLPDRMATAGPLRVINPDAGEQIGWPAYVATIRDVRAAQPESRVAVLTANYGQAGAVDHLAPELGPAYSGHNSYWDWGPPPADTEAVIVVGMPEGELRRVFADVRLAAVIDTGVRNQERGTEVHVVRGQLVSWAELWPHVRHVG